MRKQASFARQGDGASRRITSARVGRCHVDERVKKGLKSGCGGTRGATEIRNAVRQYGVQLPRPLRGRARTAPPAAGR